MFMQLSTILLICVFLLCCTGAVSRVAKRLNIPVGGIAAICLLTLALSAFSFPVVTGFQVFPASLLPVLFCVLVCGFHAETLQAVLLALVGGALAWVIQILLASFYEIGVLMALPAVLLATFCIGHKPQALLCVLLAPLFYSGMAVIENWYLFDVFQFSFGSNLQLTMQISGAFLLGIAVCLPQRRRINHMKLQKDA